MHDDSLMLVRCLKGTLHASRRVLCIVLSSRGCCRVVFPCHVREAMDMLADGHVLVIDSLAEQAEFDA